MKSCRGSVVPILALGLGLGLIAACNSLIGAGVPNQVSGFAGTGGDTSSQCLHRYSCPDSQVCLFRVCARPASRTRTRSGARCLQTAAAFPRCAVASPAASCSSENACPDGSACTAGVCRDSCSDNSKCLADQSCIAGACIGNDEPSGGSSSANASGGGAGDNGGDSRAGGAGRHRRWRHERHRRRGWRNASRSRHWPGEIR